MVTKKRFANNNLYICSMKSPFLFGRSVSTEGFTNRKKEIKRLKNNFQHGVNTLLISPRRWGKSSLVKRVIQEVSTKKLRIVQLDLLGLQDEAEFYKVLATATIKATSSKFEEWVAASKEFFKQLTPKISLGPDPIHDFEIGFNWQELERNYQEVLNLPERIAQNKGIQLVVCIDEFQNLTNFRNPLLFQKRLRSEWQHHQRVCYCLYGSQQHMMMSLFERQSMPFYKFGDVMYLNKIGRAEWVSFIVSAFDSTGKRINDTLADYIAALVQDHSYYVQQLSHMVWISTEKIVTQLIVDEALENLLEQNSILYMRDTESLSGSQLAYLKALADGVSSGLSSKVVIDNYRLGSSATVAKAKKALLNKELIEVRNNQSYFLDPMYELWFQRFVQR